MSGIIFPEDFKRVVEETEVVHPDSEHNLMISPEALENALIATFRKIAELAKYETLAIGLSGGLDSSILTTIAVKSAGLTIIPVTIFSSLDHPDLLHAVALIKHLKLWLNQLGQFDSTRREDKYELLCIAMKKANLKHLILGDAVDELQGGYWQHEYPEKHLPLAFLPMDELRKAVFEDMWKKLIPDHLAILDKFARQYDIDVYLPYLALSQLLSKVPMFQRIFYTTRKSLLRHLAVNLGIPNEIINRPKLGLGDALRTQF
ncbi:hypothetical protein A2533_00530 [Candidatus Falkowbacteria bacterium RIFOXYD2_FULL_35_9]|uniref:Asparagine synthetase domain-containing protein n=1 Tax=Candidatus Falkowbacteria bacterium RIFOXYC2_FULL_36_12 TaxID=1798002 RepID=A0A1F5T0N2_9BACT|nr:MAG: hypothetical protein A2300_04150 [Candidatus Falkowbacteria bacterium RIFOXYB2_FULL_35_7]OGF32296.1 MAG: hypothetical protein A2478_03140 [Candidatus Falkowbacteria bacterium RIFOXYC2_FULL_36_12]OGF33701.1 MAG: hypothetical protein A2223_04765 [Candidatus Falkowbacteria bacterium RIFOXYA2_FULL_35_8]OGF46653.1 MAG: hypothetical protein A2533_00530 [Candidatus Falkowbacteria bacterium RIFOXYD2_FULL_35_9]